MISEKFEMLFLEKKQILKIIHIKYCITKLLKSLYKYGKSRNTNY